MTSVREPIYVQALLSPVVSSIIITFVALWVHTYTNNLDLRPYCHNVNFLFEKKQWWRMFSASAIHESFAHLLFNITALWSYRFIERKHGSLFILKYTLILTIASKVLTTFIVKMVERRTGNVFFQAGYTSLGFSAEILGWMAFSLIASPNPLGSIIYIFGILPVPYFIGPALMLIVVRILEPKLNQLVNACGMLAGILLGMGALQILPDIYCTMCFFFNLIVISLWSVYIPQTFVGHGIQGHFEVVDVLAIMDAEEVVAAVNAYGDSLESVGTGNLNMNNDMSGYVNDVDRYLHRQPFPSHDGGNMIV